MTAAIGSSIDVKLKGRVSEKWRDGGNISAHILIIFAYFCVCLIQNTLYGPKYWTLPLNI